jgi:large subunit ribosomal protein L10
MAKTRKQKEQALADLTSAFAAAKSTVFVNYQGLKVKEADELRRAADKENIGYVVSKKTLLGKAIKTTGVDYDVVALSGMIGVATAADEVAAAKLVVEFGKTHEALKVLGGVIDGKIVDAAAVKSLASMPSRQQLLGQVVGTLNAPISGFVNVLAANIRGLVNVLNAVKNAKPAAS